MHTPVEVTEAALAAFARPRRRLRRRLGGGSTTGLGKAIAVRTGADQVVIPTTYAGSEMTDILGETARRREDHAPRSRHPPETVIYDVDLTLSLPVGLTVDLGAERDRPCDGGALRRRPQSRSSTLMAARRCGRFRDCVCRA